jgi:tape measure domain-containing protein
MANAAQLNLKLGIDVSSLSRELGKVESRMTKFGSQMQNIGSTMTQSITLPLLGVGAASLKAFADMERLELGLTAIMGSSKAAEVELQKLRKTAENPGLALPQVVQASSTLQAVGLSADAARETILQFGNATARAGKGAVVFDELIFAFSKIQSTGKITQESINQIAERLPGFSTLLQQTFGASTAERINETGISAEDFSKKTVEALSNLQRAQGGLGNSFDNLTDNITASLAELGKVINTSLNVDAIFIALSDKLNYLVQGFKKLNPETQGFIIYAGLIVASIGPTIFIVGKLITTFGALAGTTKMIIETFGKLKGVIIKAFTTILANPAILGITLAIAAIGAVALYVYDNWEAFASRFTNIWINIKNSANKGVADFMMAIDKLQKSFGVKLFDVSGLTSYTVEQKVVQKEFKSIGETVDSLSGKLKGLFLAKPKTGTTDETIIDKTKTDTGGGTGGGVKIDKSLFKFDGYKTLTEISKAKEDLDKAVLTELGPKIQEQLGFTNKGLDATSRGMKQAAIDVGVFGLAMKTNAPAFAEPFTAAEEAAAKLQDKIIDLSDAFTNILNGALNDLAVGFGEQLGNALSGAGFGVKNLLVPLAEAIISFGKMAIQAGITALAIKKALTLAQAPLAIAAGIALVAIGTAIKNGIATPKLAEGGLAFGPTMATVGDNRNARVDPEVIAPLSKLKSMMGDMGVGGVLETRISGNDLIILLNRSQKGLSRIQ